MVHSLTISLKQIVEIIKKQYIVYLDYVFYFKSRDTLNSDWEKIFTEKVRMYLVLQFQFLLSGSVAIESAITPPAPGFN